LIVLKEWSIEISGIGNFGIYSEMIFQDSFVIYGFFVKIYGTILGIMVMGLFCLG
jgi:hypothetical protein